MWKIKDEDLRKKLSSFLTDDEINRECIKQMGDNSGSIYFLHSSSPKFSLLINKSNFVEVLEYNPNDWNLYPNVTPPYTGRFLVTVMLNEHTTSVFLNHWVGPESESDWNDVIAFRACPSAYKPAGKTVTCL